MFDVDVGCGVWPFRPTPPADAASLEAWLRAEGITRACAYPLEAYLWPDPQEANDLRLPELAGSDFFVPSAVLNPTLPGCAKAYRRCREEWAVPLVRLLPNYHLYELDDPCVDALAELAAADGVALGVHVRAEDKRMQNAIAKVPPFPIDDVVLLARRHRDLRVVAFGFGRLWDRCELAPPDMVNQLQGKPKLERKAALPQNMWIELSFFEHESSLASAIKLFPVKRLLFGTHTPLFYPRANVLKVKNAEVPESVKEAVLRTNAEKLLGGRP